MDIKNPLLAYLYWLQDQEVGWADTLAADFFTSIEIVNEANIMLNATPDEFAEQISPIHGRITGAKSIGYDEEEDEIEPEGAVSKRLLDYLERFIKLNRRTYTIEIAITLYNVTSYALINFDKDPPLNLLAIHKENLIQTILDRDEEKSAELEKLIQEEYEQKVSRLKLNTNWKTFTEKDFNLQTIYNYDLNNLFEGFGLA